MPNLAPALLFVLVLHTTCSSSTLAGLITFADTGDGIPRPILFENLVVGAVSYDVIVTYNNNAASNPKRVGDLPDAMILAAATEMAKVLNALPVDDAFVTSIVMQPNIDTQTLGAGQFQFNNSVDDFTSPAEDDWTIWTTVPSPGFTQFGSGTTNSRVGFAQFTAIPEPTSLLYLCLACIVGFGLRRGSFARASNRLLA